MKKIKIEKYKMPWKEGEKTANTRDLVELCLNQPPFNAKKDAYLFTAADIEARGRIKEQLVKKGAVVEMVDDDVKLLQEIVSVSTWPLNNDGVLKFLKDIKAIK